MAITDEGEEGHTVEQMRRESVVTRLRMAQQGGYDGSTGFVRGNVYQLFGVGEKSYDSIYFLVSNIATEVEREIASAKSAAYDQGYDAGYDAGFASADDWCAQHEDEMAEHGWIRLPKDADGAPIRVGDELIDEDDKLSKPAIVKCILYNDEGCVVSDTDPRGFWYEPSLLSHHKHPTVEDVLEELLLEYDRDDSELTEIIERFAAKLRLAGGDAE